MGGTVGAGVVGAGDGPEGFGFGGAGTFCLPKARPLPGLPEATAAGVFEGGGEGIVDAGAGSAWIGEGATGGGPEGWSVVRSGGAKTGAGGVTPAPSEGPGAGPGAAGWETWLGPERC